MRQVARGSGDARLSLDEIAWNEGVERGPLGDEGHSGAKREYPNVIDYWEG